MKEMKLYKVEIGLNDRKSGDVQNWTSMYLAKGPRYTHHEEE